MIRRALNRRMAAAFLSWRAAWEFAQRRMREKVRSRAAANPDIAEKFANRLRGGGLRLRAWNIWAAAVAKPVLSLEVCPHNQNPLLHARTRPHTDEHKQTTRTHTHHHHHHHHPDKQGP